MSLKQERLPIFLIVFFETDIGREHTHSILRVEVILREYKSYALQSLPSKYIKWKPHKTIYIHKQH